MVRQFVRVQTVRPSVGHSRFGWQHWCSTACYKHPERKTGRRGRTHTASHYQHQPSVQHPSKKHGNTMLEKHRRIHKGVHAQGTYMHRKTKPPQPLSQLLFPWRTWVSFQSEWTSPLQPDRTYTIISGAKHNCCFHDKLNNQKQRQKIQGQRRDFR